MKALGRHILIELYGCPPSVLDDVTGIERSMVRAAQAAGATVVNTSFHRFSPHGVSGVVVIQESHLSIHTWPEHGFAAVDVFTCGDRNDPWAACRSLKGSLQSKRETTQEMCRGQFELPTEASVSPRRLDTGEMHPSQYTRNIWFTVRDEDIALSLRHAGEAYRKQSPYQKVEVLNTYGYGKMLAIDDAVMCTEKDEYVYHEMIAHVPMLTHPAPERVLVIGGGDGGAAREVMRHPRVAEVTVVEIDETVVEASKEHFPNMASAFDDPRLHLKIADGIQYIRQCPAGTFDLVVIDAIQPIGPAEGLFSEAFYARVRRCLSADGIMVSQTAPPALNSRAFREIHRRQRRTFGTDAVHCYLAFIPTYTTGMVSFSYASVGSAHPLDGFDPEKARDFAKRHRLQYYNGAVHRAAFALPTFVRKLLDGIP